MSLPLVAFVHELLLVNTTMNDRKIYSWENEDRPLGRLSKQNLGISSSCKPLAPGTTHKMHYAASRGSETPYGILETLQLPHYCTCEGPVRRA